MMHVASHQGLWTSAPDVLDVTSLTVTARPPACNLSRSGTVHRHRCRVDRTSAGARPAGYPEDGDAVTSVAIPGLDNAPTTHARLLDWVREMAELTTPDRVVWADGSDEEWERLTTKLVAA